LLLLTYLGIAIVSVAFQLTEACIKLYKFWESVDDSPQEVAAIRDDLQYLILIFKEIESNNNPVGHCIVEGVQRCRIKVKVGCQLFAERQTYSHRLGTNHNRREIRSRLQINILEETKIDFSPCIIASMVRYNYALFIVGNDSLSNWILASYNLDHGNMPS
jgi:hypothetical protein